MTDTLDSRRLRSTDCYGQRFMKAGTYRYAVLPIHGQHVTDDRPFTVQVKPGGSNDAKMKQQNVVVRSKDGKFLAEPPEVAIDAGDLVLWNSQGTASPYVVVGDKEFFTSDRLYNESGYSHAFGSAGDYHWIDSYGSGASGVVRVQDPDGKQPLDLKRWRELLARGTLVTVTEARAEPAEVQILTGQTVFFAITKGPGVSITDRRLLPKESSVEVSVSTRAKKGNKRS